MREEKVFINDSKVNYRVAGEGQPILILHGWGGSSDSWRKIQKILAKRGYRVIAPDLPGFGKSITPPKPWGVKDYSDFILKFTKKLETSNFFLLGHSFGGRIAIKFTVDHPEKVKKLILCDSAGIKPEPGLKIRLIYFISQIGNFLFSKKHLVRFKDGARNSFYTFLRNRDYVKADGIMRETIKRILEEDLLSDLSQIQAKTLLIWGERDRLVPLKYGYLFKEKIKSSRLEILAKIGHSPHLEAPEKLAEIITKFLRS